MMKNRVIRSFISCTLIVCMLTGLLPVNIFSLIASQATAHAEDFSSGDGKWLYRIADDGCAEILGYSDPNAVSLTIPAAVEGAWVTRIAENAFADNATLETIDIPAAVAQIAAEAFPQHEALMIRTTNGTAALAFAAQRGFDVVNTSAFDFFADILDLSEMKSSQFAIVGDMVTISAPYAQQIAVGTKVFLPATGSYANGLPIEVCSVTQSGTSVVATFVELPFTETVETYSVEDVPLTVDYDNIVMLSDGFSMLQTANRWSLSVGQKLEFNVDFKPLEDVKVSGKISYEPKYTISLDYSWFSVNEFSYKNSTTTKIEASVSCDLGEFKDKMPSKPIKFARVPLTSPTLISVWLDCSFEIGLEGEVVLETSLVTAETFTWKKGSAPTSTKTKTVDDISLSAAVEVSAGVKCSLAINVGFSGTSFNTDVVQLSLSVGVKVKAEVTLEAPDCTDVTLSAYFTVSVKIGILSGKHAAVALNMTLFSLTWVIDKWHIEKPFKIVDDCTNDSSHTVTFVAGTTYSPETLSVEDGYKMTGIKDPVRDGYTFIGWFTDTKLTDEWDFANDTVTKDITLYAGWQTSDGTLVTPAPTTTPDTDDPAVTPTIPPINSEEVSLTYLEYEIRGEGVTITGYTGNPLTLTIPAEIEGYPVKAIGSYAFQNCDSLTYVSIPEGVTTIADYAFENCDKLQEVSLPSTLRSIGYYAFEECKALESISLPSGLESIGRSAFMNCDSLTYVSIPEGVTTIADFAFENCDKLQEVKLPSSWNDCGYYPYCSPFVGCPLLTEIVVPEGMTALPSNAFDGMTSLQEVSLPSTLTSIGSRAFNECTALESISLPSGLESIGRSAFMNCDSLTYVSIPEGVTAIDAYAFAYNDNLQEVKLPASWSTVGSPYVSPFVGCPLLTEMVVPEGMTALPGDAFDGMTSLQKVSLPSTLTAIYGSAFRECTALESIALPPGLKKIGSHAFENCDSLMYVSIPEGVTAIDAYAFAYNDNLQEVKLPASWSTVGSPYVSPFLGCPLLVEIVVPEGVTAIPGDAFDEMTSLQHVSLPSTLTAIYGAAFGNCTSLSTLVIPPMVNSINSNSFSGCTALSHVYVYGEDSYAANYFASNHPAVQVHVIPVTFATVSFVSNGGTSVASVYTLAGTALSAPNAPTRAEYTFTGWYTDAACTTPWNFASGLVPEGGMTLYAGWAYTPAGYHYNLGTGAITGYTGGNTHAVLPDSYGDTPLTRLAAEAIPASTRTLYIPAGITQIDPQAFRWAENLSAITVDAANPVYTAENGVLYTLDGTLVAYPKARTGSSFAIPDGTTGIGSYAFHGCAALTSLEIPASVTKLAAYAIYDCAVLESVSFAADAATIGNGCFLSCADELMITGPIGASVLTGYADSVYLNYNQYTVTYMENGALLGAARSRAGELLGQPLQPEEGILSFRGWATDEEGESLWDFTNDLMPAEDLTLYAVWRYDFTMEETDEGIVLTGYTGSKTTIHVPESIDDVPVVAIADDAFPDNTVTLVGNKGSVTEAYAAAQGMSFEALTYTLTFISNGGTPVESQEHCATELLTAPQVTRYGYRLMGWYRDAALTESWGFATDLMPAGPLTLYAEWELEDESIALVPFTFDAVENGLVIMGYTGTMGAAEIPAEINGIPVIGIADHAFSDDSALLQVTVPGSVTSIGASAFAGSRIGSVTLESGVMSIGAYAFSDCSELSSIILADTVTEIGAAAFLNCTALTEIALPDRVSILNEHLFNGCIYLTQVQLPAALTDISASAFAGCSRLEALDLSENVAQIATSAFNGCSRLKAITVSADNMYFSSIDGVLLSADGLQLLLYPHGKADATYTIPASVLMIAENAMAGSRIQTLVIGDSLQSIGSSALRGSLQLKQIEFAQTDGSLAAVGSYAFNGCISLTDIVLPDSLTSLDEYAFANCNLNSVTAPASVRIGANAFKNSTYMILYGTRGSAAQSYASVYGLRFIDPATDIPVCGVLLPETLMLTVGQEYQLEASLIPADATETTIQWSSTDASVVYVSADGLLSARGTGSASISAQAMDGSTALCFVTVEDGSVLPEQLILSSTELTLEAGSMYPLTAQILPDGAENANIVWTTSDGAAAIYSNGCIFALTPGEAVITATLGDELSASCVVTVREPVPPVEITVQPVDVLGAEGDMVEVDLTAVGEGLTYAWYFKDAGAEKFRLTTSFTDNRYYVKMNSARAGRQVYCVVTDAKGNIATSDVVTLNMMEPIRITVQPTDAYAVEGENAVVTVAAKGEGLTYAWYFKDAGAKAFKLTTAYKTNTYKIEMTQARSGRQIYCVVTDQHGQTETSDVATLYMQNETKIIRQPESVIAAVGEMAEVSVTAVGKGLSYAWYFKDASAKEFKLTTSFTGNRYYVTMTEARADRQVYCVVTDAMGNAVTTNTVMLSTEQPKIITTQPTDAYAAEGENAVVTVAAKGEGLIYTWYFKDAGAKEFKLTTSFTGDRYYVAMNEARAGRQIYCVVTDQYGWTATSDVVTLYLQNEAKIIRQPESVTAAVGEMAEVSVTAVGKGLSYAWYFKDASAKEFKLTTSFTGNRYYVTMTEARTGRQIYCVVTDAFGNAVTTDTVTLSMAQPEIITAQPTDAYAAEGETAVVTVAAKGEGLTYAWYFKDAGAKTFKLTTAYKTNTYKIEMTEVRAGRQVYCVVTDQHGQTETSVTVTLYMQNEAKIIRQPESVAAAVGEMAEVGVTAVGKGLSYAWYFKDASAKEFKLTTSFTGNRYYVTMTEARAGRQVYCVVTDALGNAVTSDTATLNADISMSSKEAAMIGDVNGDGLIDMLDPLNLAAWLESEDVSFIVENADVNADGVISEQDVSTLVELCCAPEE